MNRPINAYDELFRWLQAEKDNSTNIKMSELAYKDRYRKFEIFCAILDWEWTVRYSITGEERDDLRRYAYSYVYNLDD